MMQELVQQLKNLAKDSIAGMHTAIPGKIVSFNPETGLAVVSPAMKYKKPDGSTLDYPNITGVPVVFPQGAAQKASIVYPVHEGDGCLLIVSEQSLDYWMFGRETASSLPFDLTNSIAIVGLFQKAGAGIKKACAEDAVVITAGNTQFSVSPDGVSINGNFTVSGGVVRLN